MLFYYYNFDGNKFNVTIVKDGGRKAEKELPVEKNWIELTEQHSILDDIEGIGPARRKALMRNFMSLDAIKAASVEELAQIPSMNEKAAESVYKFFHK